MPTTKDLLSQKIFEIPDVIRESFTNIEIDYRLAYTICAASLYISRKLQSEDEFHPLTLFAEDRIKDILAVIQDNTNLKYNISGDVDMFSFMRFSCEQTIINIDDFCHDLNINGTQALENKETLREMLNLSAIALTANITVILTSGT